MHRGDPDLHTLTSDDIEGMRHAVRHCGRIPGLLQVVGEERSTTLKAAWGTNAYRTGLALVLRPETMSSTRGGLRRFGLWLDTERPRIASLDQLNRANMVDFMESVHRLHKIKHPDQPLSRAYRAGIISTVAMLFRYAAVAEWDDVSPPAL